MRIEQFIGLVTAIMLLGCTRTPEQLKHVSECAAPSEGRACAMCFACDSTVYVVGGRTQNGKYASTMLVYDVRNDTWSKRNASPLSPRVHGTACRTHQGVFLGLGFAGGSIYQDTTHLRDWWLYDPKADSWTACAPFPSNKTVAPISWTDNEHVWVALGYNGFTQEVWQYTIATDSWAALPDAPCRQMSCVAADCQGRHFLGTGYRRVSTNGWWEWFADGHCESRSSVPGQGRHNAACAATNEAVWVIGGWHYGDSLTTGFHFRDILRYTPHSDSWVYSGEIPCGATENGVACSIGNTLWFGLGENEKGQLHTHWYRIED